MATTTAPTPARERSLAFNQAYPIGTPVFYRTPRGKQIETFTTGTSWDRVPGPEGQVLVELAPAQGLPAPPKANGGWHAYDIARVSPNPSGTPGPPYGTVEALAKLLAATFHLGLSDALQSQVYDFARDVCAHNLVERLRSQLSDYVVCQALGAPVGKVSFQAFANPGPGFLVGLWNAHDYATSRAEAEAKLTQQGSAL